MGWATQSTDNDVKGSVFSSSPNIDLAAAIDSDTSLKEFQESYLGNFSSAPTQTKYGSGIQAGMLYFNSSTTRLQYFDGSNWQNSAPTPSEQTNINTVAADGSDIGTVAGISSNVTTVAGISSNVTTVAGISSNVTSVAGNSSNINTVAGNNTNVNTVAGISGNVTTVAGISSNVTAVAGDATDIGTVASNISNVNTVAAANSNISTVVTNISNINAVAADATDIGAVAGKATEIGLLGTSDAVADMALLGTSAVVADMALLGTSAVITDMDLLATSANVTNMATLGASGVVANIATVAGNNANITTVAGNDSNITTVATNNSNITAVAGKATEIGRLGTADAVADMAILGTTDVVADMNTLATSDIVADMALLATTDVISDMNTLAVSSVISDMSTLAGGGGAPNITSLTASGAVTAGSFVIGSANINENDLEAIDDVTAGTVAASKVATVDANKDITGFRNITLTGELDAGSLDIEGNADINGTLEADAITIDDVALSEYISDTVGAMVSGNTETGITVTYDDSDNTLDFAIGTLNQDTSGNAATATLATTTTVTDSTANTNFPVVFHNESNGLLDDTGTFHYNPNTGLVTAANLTLSGNLTVNGSTTTVNTATLTVEDPLISLAKANNSSDSVDIGMYGLYDTSGSQDLYGGFFRDASDSGKWKLFKDLTAAPTTTVDTSDGSYAGGTLVATLEGSATTLATGRTIGMTGDVVWTSASFNGSGNVTGTATIQNDAVGADQLASNAVVNASVASSAAIAFSKMENLTASRALVSDGNGDVSPATTTSTEIGYVNGVTSAIQTQLNTKASSDDATALAIALG